MFWPNQLGKSIIFFLNKIENNLVISGFSSIFNLLIYSANSNSYFFLLSSSSSFFFSHFFKLYLQHVIHVTNVTNGTNDANYINVTRRYAWVCGVYAGVCGCAWLGVSMCGWMWDEFSEYLLETRFLTSANYNTHPLRIFFFKFSTNIFSVYW